ncbi:STAS domain-containing protein [Streptomyces sp. NPDC056144]|uniref:STAS domain-containing protein n=1 Tax=unclassified Streptomyces TaxID=2593676 RepID=UPI0035E261F9
MRHEEPVDDGGGGYLSDRFATDGSTTDGFATDGFTSGRFARDRFTVEIRPVPGADTDVLVLTGELDRDTVAPLTAAVEERLGVRRTVVDCSYLRFCDSSGLNALLRARLRTLEAGGRLDLAGLRAPVSRMFDITGARGVFRVYGTLGEALAESGGEGGGGGDGGDEDRGGSGGGGARDGER